MEIQLLGSPGVRDGPIQRKVAGRQGALLAVLALHAPEPVSVDRLADVVWNEDVPRDAANALQQRISRLRNAVDPGRRGGVLTPAAGGYALHVDEREIDVHRFEELAAAGRRQLLDGDWSAAEVMLTRALGLWRGPALDGFADELWALGESRRLEELRLAAAEDRIEAVLALEDYDRATSDLAELTAAHPLRERLRGQLMLALYGAGRQADALAVYDETRRLLADELGVDPGPQLQRIHHQILTQDTGLNAEPSSPSRSPSPPANGNLPALPRGVVGRDQALDQIAHLLHHARLLTLTGPGGAGKTTLAVEAARRQPRPPHGTWLVELAPVSTSEAVVTTIASALGITGGGLGAATIDAAALTRTLVDRQLLVVLDNCEHQLDTVIPLVERLLAEAPGVQVLTTSREPLGVTGEVVWSVPGLGVPDAEHTTAEQIMAAPAVQLLVERVRAHTQAFTVTDATAPAAATLTRRLDGIPLAIELAAARLRVLSLTEVTDGLDDRFRLLARRGRTAASRHRTLRAALDWSWDLLDRDLRRAWAALAVPADRFDLATASALLDAVDVDSSALDVVADMVDRSLLTADTLSHPTRYRMLESIRDYGRERLIDQGLVDDVHDAHADVVEAALAACTTSMSAQHFDVDIAGLAASLDDARSALAWAEGRGDRLRMQRIAGLLGWLWLLHGLSVEGLGWLDRGLGSPEQADPASDDPAALFWGSALRAAGTLAADGVRWGSLAVQAATTPVDRVLAQVCAAGHQANTGNVEEAVATLDACAAEAEEIGGWPLGFARLIAGQLDWASGRLGTARRHTEEAVALLTAAGADWARVHALETLIDDATARGDFCHARDLALEGLRICRRQRYPELESAMLIQLAFVAHELGEPEDAARSLDQAVARAAATGSSSGLARAHHAAGTVARRRGEVHTALKHLHTALRLASEAHLVSAMVPAHTELAHTAVLADSSDAAVAHGSDALAAARRGGDPRALALTLEALAGAITITDDPRGAVTLLATATAIREASHLPTSPPEQRDIERVTDRLRSRIGSAAFDQLWAEAHGRATDEPGEMVEWAIDTHGRVTTA